MSTLESSHADVLKALAENTSITRKVDDNTESLVEMMTVARSGLTFFFAVGRLIRRIVMWLGPFITLAGIIWALLHGKWPEQP